MIFIFTNKHPFGIFKSLARGDAQPAHEPTSYPVRALANILDYCWLTKLMVTGSIYNKNHELVLDQEKPYPKIWGQGKLSKVKYLPWTPLVKDQREVNYKYFDPGSKYLSKKLWRVVFSLPQSREGGFGSTFFTSMLTYFL